MCLTMTEPIIARWKSWAGDTSEHLVLRRNSESIVAEAVVVSAADEPYAARYRIVCNLSWRVREVEIDLIGDERRLRLKADGEGHWSEDSCGLLPELDGAVDVDLSISSFTNTLPIRRLGMQPRQSAEIEAAYIRIPELSITKDPQRYTCLEDGNHYRYESLNSDFTRDIEVDDEGLVLIYPRLFRRVL